MDSLRSGCGDRRQDKKNERWLYNVNDWQDDECDAELV